MDDHLSADKLHELCMLTAELTRQKLCICEHLCIENFAPELLGNLIRAHAKNQLESTHDTSNV